MMSNLTDKEVKSVLLRYHELQNAQPHRGYLADFFLILDQNVRWGYKDLLWEGHRGFEDHQEGKRKVFNEKHDVFDIKIELDANKATVYTQANWRGSFREPPATTVRTVKALHKVTWEVVKKSDGRVLITSHYATSIEMIEGKMPNYLNNLR